MQDMNALKEKNLAGRRVIVRIDTDVALENGKVADDYRLKAALPTIRQLSQGDAILTLIGHLGRPKGKVEPKLCLAPVAKRLAQLLVPGSQARTIHQESTPSPVWATHFQLAKNITLLDNLRFDPGEETNAPEFAQLLADNQDYFVNESFATVHRVAASTVGITQPLPSYAGWRLVDELAHLSLLLHSPAQPFVLILGGAKVPEKLGLLGTLLPKVDAVLTGGGVANMFLKARGEAIKNSLIEPELMATASQLLDGNQASKIHLPTDVVWGPGDKIMDIGRTATRVYEAILKEAKTIFWAGSLGVAEAPKYSLGTRTIAAYLAAHKGVKIIGGGDTATALQRFGLRQKMTFVSTGGGAALEYLAGKELPGLKALDK